MLSEWEKLAREAAAKSEAYESYLLRLTEAEVTTRSANALAARVRAAGFPVVKDFDTFDFTAPVGAQAEGAGDGARGVGRGAHQLLPDRQCRNWENAPGDQTHLHRRATNAQQRRAVGCAKQTTWPGFATPGRVGDT